MPATRHLANQVQLNKSIVANCTCLQGQTPKVHVATTDLPCTANWGAAHATAGEADHLGYAALKQAELSAGAATVCTTVQQRCKASVQSVNARPAGCFTKIAA